MALFGSDNYSLTQKWHESSRKPPIAGRYFEHWKYHIWYVAEHITENLKSKKQSSNSSSCPLLNRFVNLANALLLACQQTDFLHLEVFPLSYFIAMEAIH